jgi:hypothetical protein
MLQGVGTISNEAILWWPNIAAISRPTAGRIGHVSEKALRLAMSRITNVASYFAC